MDERIDSLGEATVFSTLDANGSYWQIEIEKSDRDKTAFTSPHGLYRFIRMPFGLRNAPGTFQRTMDVILSTVKWQFALVYLDDIVVFSRTPVEHIDHVRHVLTLLHDDGVILKLKKCRFFTDTIDYLSHVIRPRRSEIASHTTDAIRGLQTPTSPTELRSFLGLCNVSAASYPTSRDSQLHSISAYARISQPHLRPSTLRNWQHLMRWRTP